eukprot:COSAG05_NODE_442_length_9803_cov_28.091921_9_plen_445_part_00
MLLTGTCAVGAYGTLPCIATCFDTRLLTHQSSRWSSVDMRRRHIYCGNLGDSRAVVGVLEDGYIVAEPLSRDHSASEDAEKFRLRSEHPMDSNIVVEQYDEWKEDYDCVVKSVTRFSRSEFGPRGRRREAGLPLGGSVAACDSCVCSLSCGFYILAGARACAGIGDAHMKDRTCAKLFNSYRCGVSVEPVPRKGAPYISNEADVKDMPVENGFVIVACDGIWDEMTSDEAVHLCQHLIQKHAGQSPPVNIADEFLNETLKKATARLRRTDPDEEELTLEQLKRRPLGKSGRSMLHDDLTCVIIQWRSSAAPQLAQRGVVGGAGVGGAVGWKMIKKTVEMHTQIKHRKKLKWARLMDDMMVMVRQEREGHPSILTSRILAETEEDEDDEAAAGVAGSTASVLSLGAGDTSMASADFTRAVAAASQAAVQAAKAAVRCPPSPAAQS